MPRYVNHDSGQLWEIALSGNGVETRFGPLGGEAETSRKTWSDARAAQTAYDKIAAPASSSPRYFSSPQARSYATS